MELIPNNLLSYPGVSGLCLLQGPLWGSTWFKPFDLEFPGAPSIRAVLPDQCLFPPETSIKPPRAEHCGTVKWMGLHPSSIQASGCQLLKRKKLFFNVEKDVGIPQHLKGSGAHEGGIQISRHKFDPGKVVK